MTVKRILRMSSANYSPSVLKLIGIVFVLTVLGCSATQSQTPEDFVKVFLKKHIPHIDISIADFYVKEEQPLIRELIAQQINGQKKEGTYDSLKKAIYDFSDISITVIDRKSTYIDDEPQTLVEVAVKGFFTKKLNDQTETLLEEEVFVLKAIGGEWKITNKIKPWKEA